MLPRLSGLRRSSAGWNTLAGWMCSTLCACLLGLPTLAVAQAQANTAAEVAPPRPAAITVVSDDNYPPYILRDARDRLQGILVDSWALWEKRTGVRVDLRAMDWAKAQQTLLAGKADVIDTIFATEARRALYEFTQPYARLDVPIFFHESLSGIVNADSMNGFTIGVKEGDNCIEVLGQRGVDSLKRYPSYSAVISAAARGELKVFCVDQPPAQYLLNRIGVAQEYRHSIPLYSGEFHRAVKKGNTAMLRLVEDGFAQITAAERRAIDDKWFGAPLDGRGALFYARYGAYALLGSLLFAALLVAWNLTLRRRVQARTAELSHSLAAQAEAKRSAELTLAQLNATLGAIPDLLFEIDENDRYCAYIATRPDLLAAPPDQFMGRSVHEVMPGENADIVVTALREAAREGASKGAQMCLPLPQGDTWFELSVARKHMPDGQADHYIVLSRDISDRKRAELSLRQSEQSFRHFFDAGLVGMSITLPDRRWVRVNARLAEMLGYALDELDRLSWFELTHPDDRALDSASYERMLNGEIEGYTVDKRYLRKDGGVIEASVAMVCERDAQGRAQRIFAIVEDISQRKRAERELARHFDELELLVEERSHELVQARNAAERASRAKTEFLSRMSHELRTPLNAILGFSQLLELDRTLPDRPQRFVKEILGAGEHLLALINEVLDLAQVEAGRITLSPELLSMAEIGKEVLTLMQPLAEQRQVVLSANLDAAHGVRADRTRLKQVLVNLVSNAIKYNVDGGTVSLESTVQDDQTLRIGVHDTGTGISPERLPYAFEAFNRLGVEGGAIEGTGIGLSICRRLVELMGGKISVHSRLGEGSEFRVELPRAQVTEVAQPSVHRPASTPDGPSQQAAGRRLLYVEDNPANVRLMQGIVGRHAHLHLFTAPTAALGIEMARTQRPDLLLLDINLPDMDGHALLGALRADPATRDIPAVAVTANAMADDRTRARHAGFNEYLAKPIDLPRFEAMLERLLGDAASRN